MKGTDRLQFAKSLEMIAQLYRVVMTNEIVARCQCDRDVDGALQCRWVWDCITD